MGLFGKKSKTTPSPIKTPGNQSPLAVSGASFDSASSSSLTLSKSGRPPATASQSEGHISQLSAPSGPPVSLTVALDSFHVDGKNDTFVITVPQNATVEFLRQTLQQKLGNVAMGLFKVSIPSLAVQHAQSYTDRYKIPVDLISCFPSFSLDDPSQLARSLGTAAWQAMVAGPNPSPTLMDWWPHPVAADVVSILVRTAPVTDGNVPTNTIPFTLLTHIALVDPAAPVARSAASPPPKGRRTAPAVIDILPQASVAELKRAVVAAAGRGQVEDLDKVVLWRVEMSEEEMVVIEERGGLKGGQMPWPYPPTASVPVALSDSSESISKYYTEVPSARMIGLSAWIHPSCRSNAPEIDIPRFRYPMLFLSPSTPNSTCPSVVTPSLPSSPVPDATSPKATKSRRPRPSTAPAIVTNGPRVFGASSASPIVRHSMRSMTPSPLQNSTLPQHSSFSDLESRGLGIQIAPQAGYTHLQVSSQHHSPTQPQSQTHLHPSSPNDSQSSHRQRQQTLPADLTHAYMQSQQYSSSSSPSSTHVSSPSIYTTSTQPKLAIDISRHRPSDASDFSALSFESCGQSASVASLEFSPHSIHDPAIIAESDSDVHGLHHGDPTRRHSNNPEVDQASLRSQTPTRTSPGKMSMPMPIHNDELQATIAGLHKLSTVDTPGLSPGSSPSPMSLSSNSEVETPPDAQTVVRSPSKKLGGLGLSRWTKKVVG